MPKLIRIVVPFSAGASNDAVARAIAVPLGQRLQATVIVENKAGAAGVIGSDAVAKSAHDGSVLLLTSSTFLTSAATQTHLPYDPIAAFTPVAMVGEGPLLLAVSAATPFKSPAELFAAARSKPDDLTYGTAGVGSLGHLATELMSDAAKVRMRHVPYKGAANAAQDLAGGQIDVMVSNYSTLAPLIQKSGGKVRPLAGHVEAAAPVVRRPAAARRRAFLAIRWTSGSACSPRRERPRRWSSGSTARSTRSPLLRSSPSCSARTGRCRTP